LSSDDDFRLAVSDVFFLKAVKSFREDMKRTVVLIILLCFIQWEVFAQSKVVLSGSVKAKKGSTISQALVSVEGTSLGAYTNKEGRYTLKMNPGKYTIVVSFMGYKTIKSRIKVQKNKVQNFKMEEDAIVLKSFEVEGKTKSRKLKEGAFTVNAIDIKPLINNTNNLNAIIGRSNGIKIRENGGIGGDFDLSINGLSGNSVRYFIDGIPLSSMGSGINLANIPTNIIDRIEIYKGVVPARLGADALGGAINIITKKNKRNYIDVSYGYGSFGTHKADFNGQYTQESTGITIKPSVSYCFSKNNYEMRGIEVWDEESREFIKTNLNRYHNDYKSVLGQIEAGITNKSWCDALLFSASYSNIDKELQTGATQSIVYGMATRESESFKVSARYKKKDFLINNLTTNIYLSHTQKSTTITDTVFRKYDWLGNYINSGRSEIGGRGKSIRYTKRPLTIVRTNLNYSINKQHSININYMLTYLKNDREDKYDKYFESSEDAFGKHIIGLSYTQNLLNGKLNNNIFIKDYYSQLEVKQMDLYWITGSDDKTGTTTTNNIGYGLGTKYKLAEELSIKTSYEHSVRLPRSRELLGNGATVYPNFNLKPESSDNLNIGLFGDIKIAERHALNYETNFFVRKAKDYIRLVIAQTEGLSQYDNVSSVNIKGIEGELTYDYDDFLQIKANASYLDERSGTKYQEDGKPEITYNNRMPNRPWIYSNVELNLQKRNLFGQKGTQLRFGYNFQYVHWFYLTWEGYGALKSKSTIPSQYISNANISYGFSEGKYNISLECKNLFNRTAYDNYMLQKPGRSFFCKFRIFINKF